MWISDKGDPVPPVFENAATGICSRDRLTTCFDLSLSFPATMSQPEEVQISNSDNRDGDGPVKVQNEDELRLAQMGHKQELVRHFSVWSLIGLAANCTISWTGAFAQESQCVVIVSLIIAGLGLGLITAINAGGPGARMSDP